MELFELLTILSRYKWPIVVLCLSAVINAVALTYVVTEKYESTALVLVRPQEDINITGRGKEKEALSFPLSTLVPFGAIARTYGEVIRSEAVATKVVEELGLDQEQVSKNWFRRWKDKIKGYLKDAWTYLKYGRLEASDPFNDAVELVKQSLKVTPTKDTYVFEIAATFKDPDVASAIVNSAASVFVEYNRNIYDAERGSTREFLEQQLTESEATLDLERNDIQAFKERNGIVSLGRELRNKIDQLAEFENKQQLAEQDIAAASAEIKFLNDQVGSGKSRGPEPRIISAAVRQELMSDLLRAEARLKNRRASKLKLDGVVENRRLELKTLPEKQRRLADLELDVHIAEDTHQFIKKAYDEARLQEADKADEIRVISSGKASLYPLSPIKVYYAGAALALALVIGMALALLLEYLNITIRTVDHAEKVLGLPALATLPPMKI